jgi:hypothetical protein
LSEAVSLMSCPTRVVLVGCHEFTLSPHPEERAVARVSKDD